MKGLGDKLFSGSALAAHKHREIGLCHLLDHLEHAAHGGAGAHEVLEAEIAIDALEQHAMLPLQAGVFKRSLHDDADLIVVERLWHVILRSGLHRLDGDLLGAVRSDHDDGGLGPGRLHLPQNVHAGEALA